MSASHRLEKRLEDVEILGIECDGCGAKTEQVHETAEHGLQADGWGLITLWRFPFAADARDMCPQCLERAGIAPAKMVRRKP